ncbi:hypothetical protein BD626DRAFT_568663 [Schizophyllum amplum]|uniref:DUF6534 domain-containing protein n=1 Tax=Schizophyllum amplum TaxID=97359 RepID=A0A550CGZ4_9AGAR|nr:hypothetical protein BD626DRAFT_568663 [Auriculariopsis ampla]
MADPSSVVAPNPAFAAHGPMLLGTFFNVILYGISVTQTYLYWNNFSRKDAWYISSFVAFLFVADTVHTGFTLAYIYNCLINHFGDGDFLSRADWLFATDPALTGIIGGTVQIFFAWRVKILTGNIYLALTIVACSFASLLCGIATAIACGIVPAFVDFLKFKSVVTICERRKISLQPQCLFPAPFSLPPFILPGLAASSVSDILITCTLVFHLRKHRSGFTSTDSQVDRIIRLTVQTGLLTAIWAFADMILYLLEPTAWHLMFNFALSKLYTNSLMSSLNSRKGWQYSDSKQDTSHITPSTDRGVRRDVVNLSSTRPEVFVQVESHAMVDMGDETKGSLTDGRFGDEMRSGWETDKAKRSVNV